MYTTLCYIGDAWYAKTVMARGVEMEGLNKLALASLE